MSALAGVFAFFVILMIGANIGFIAIVGLIACRVYRIRTGKAAKLWIKALLWIILAAGIAISAFPLSYFCIIVASWF